MIRAVFLVALLTAAAPPTQAETLWLVIGVADTSPTQIAGAGRPFYELFPRGFVARTSDCGDSSDFFIWVATASRSLHVAEEALSRLRDVADSAYLRRCDVKPGSLLAAQVSAVEDSLANVPTAAQGWRDQSFVSSAHRLPDGDLVFVQPYFVDDEYSELYGWRERVGPDLTYPLEVDCKDAGGFAARDTRLALHCGQEWVAEQLLHAVIVYDEHGRQLDYVEHCRDPVWTGDQTIACNAERVTFEGAIALEEKQFHLPQEIIPQGPSERLWLVVGASDPTPGGIARQSKALSDRFPRGFVVQTSDCGESRNVFAWVAEAATSREAAEAALHPLRAVVKDAYVKRCDARPGTLLALRINAVDRSVAGMSDWGYDEADGVSSVHPLADGRLIVIPRSFEVPESDPATILEPVLVTDPPSKDLELLIQNCTYPGHFITQEDLLAFDCAPEVFADYLVYHVFVFDRAGRRLAHVRRCRYPIWSADHVIACRKLVWADGPAEHRLIRTVIRR